MVIGVLAVLGGIVGGAIVATQQQRAEVVLPFAFYVLAGGFYFVPGFYLRRYAAHLRGLMKLRRSEHLEAAMEAQKTFWRLVGILIAVVLGLYVLLIGAAAGLGMAGLLG